MTNWSATYKTWDVEYRKKFEDQHTLPTCETQLDEEACVTYQQGAMTCRWSTEHMKCSIKADEIISQITEGGDRQPPMVPYAAIYVVRGNVQERKLTAEYMYLFPMHIQALVFLYFQTVDKNGTCKDSPETEKKKWDDLLIIIESNDKSWSTMVLDIMKICNRKCGGVTKSKVQTSWPGHGTNMFKRLLTIALVAGAFVQVNGADQTVERRVVERLDAAKNDNMQLSVPSPFYVDTFESNTANLFQTRLKVNAAHMREIAHINGHHIWFNQLNIPLVSNVGTWWFPAPDAKDIEIVSEYGRTLLEERAARIQAAFTDAIHVFAKELKDGNLTPDEFTQFLKSLIVGRAPFEADIERTTTMNIPLRADDIYRELKSIVVVQCQLDASLVPSLEDVKPLFIGAYHTMFTMKEYIIQIKEQLQALENQMEENRLIRDVFETLKNEHDILNAEYIILKGTKRPGLKELMAEYLAVYLAEYMHSFGSYFAGVGIVAVGYVGYKSGIVSLIFNQIRSKIKEPDDNKEPADSKKETDDEPSSDDETTQGPPAQKPPAKKPQKTKGQKPTRVSTRNRPIFE
jgi:hypothetical protein